ncbi:MAG: hypothetical protein IJ630_09560 [Treponema sp.]|nr:hypothetical protein [Treponema sp.]
MPFNGSDYIQNRLNYTFKKENLLLQAITRRSYSSENPAYQNNQVLEFIGDSVLSLCTVKTLCQESGNFNKYNQFVSSKDEGQLSEKRKSLVNKNNLAECIDNLGFAQFLLLGKSDENNDVRNKTGAKEDTFEAILGAVALDCNFDIATLNRVCNTMLKAKPTQIQKTSNLIDNNTKEMRAEAGKPKYETAVCKLNELYQKGYISKPKYIFTNTNTGWKCTCKVQECNHNWSNSEPKSRKSEARQISAFWVLMDLLGYECN